MVLTSARQASVAESDSALVDAVGVSDELDFVQKLLAVHEWRPEARREIESALKAIRLRQSDTNLHLGVVGEFSSGKTTLINALMRDDLLKTDVLQATTAAATWMRHGAELDIEIDFVDGERRTYREDGIGLWQRFSAWFRRPSFETEKERLRAFIHKLTADEEIAVQLSAVTILHPAAAFQRGLVIIDTPGANAENQRHVEVAGATLREHCDAAIVVIPADIPVSQSLVGFLRDHVRDILHRCIFVVTKMDTIRRPRERERLIDTVRARLLSELGLSQVRLFAAAPRVVIDDAIAEEHSLAPEEVDAFIEGFAEFEREAWNTMEASRTVVLLERLALLLTRLLEWLPSELQGYEQRYSERHAALQNAKIPDLGSFVRKRQRAHQKALDKELRSLPDEASRMVGQAREVVMSGVREAIFATTDKKELKILVSQQVPGFVEEQNHALRAELGTLEGKIQRGAEAQLGKFEVEFKKIYQTLQTLGGKLPVASTHRSLGSGVASAGTVPDGVTKATSLLEESEVAEMWAVGGGAGAGAFLGTLVFPGVGTVIGAALGSFLGSLFGPNLDQLQRQSWGELQQAIKAAFDQTESAAKDSVTAATTGAGERLVGAIDAYFKQYGTLVATMIERDQEEQRELQRRRAKIERDIHEVGARTRRITKVRESLRGVHVGS